MQKCHSPSLWLAIFAFAIPSVATAAPLYWNVFNIEEETAQTAQFVTYASLEDMLNDDNRLGVFNPDGFTAASVGNNIVGSGAFVRSTMGVPEPGTMILFAFGLLGVGVAAPRRRMH